jgi:hypothetical protein
MTPQPDSVLKQRVIRASEAALEGHQYVSPIDVLQGMGLLHSTHVDSWRRGRVNSLDELIQGSPKKISASLSVFQEWAHSKGLQPAETAYVRTTRDGPVELRFTASADPAIERFFRTHFVSPTLSERQREKLQERVGKAPQPVVFEIVRDSQCSECGVELDRGSFLYMEAGQPLCLQCARMGDLEYLPAGDTALTRRSTKYSWRTTVVVRFSKSRGRYERQGILAEKAAIEKAEAECLGDAGERARERQRAAALREEQDRELSHRMAARIRELLPGCPPGRARDIARHTAMRGSGRVGRTAAGRNLDGQALTMAVVAAIRHRYTAYDELLARGLERSDARAQVADQVDELLAAWRGR